MLLKKLCITDTCEFVLKTKYDTDKSDLEKKIIVANKKVLDTSGLGKQIRS